MPKNQILFFLGFFLLSGFGITVEKSQATGVSQKSGEARSSAMMQCIEEAEDINYAFCSDRVRIVEKYCHEMSNFIDENCQFRAGEKRAKEEERGCARTMRKTGILCQQRAKHDNAACLVTYARDVANCLPPNPEQAGVWEYIGRILWRSNEAPGPFEFLALKGLSVSEAQCLLDEADSNYEFCKNKAKDKKDYCKAMAGTVNDHCKNKAENSEEKARCEIRYARGKKACDRQLDEELIVCGGVFTILAISCMQR